MKNILLTIVVTFAFAGYTFAECSAADKKALEAFDHAWSVAGENGDRAALMSILADDYTGLPAMVSKSQNIQDAMAAYERSKANPQGRDRISSDNYLISCTPLTATITHRNVITAANGPGGKEETFYSRSVHVLEKRGGKWQAVSSANHSLDDQGILMYMEHDWATAEVKRDMGWFERSFASDYTGISSRTGKRSSKSEEIEGMKNDKSVTEFAEPSQMNIRIEGNAAYVTGIYRTKGRDEKGQAFDRRISYTDTYIRRDGRWQVWASQGTPLP